MLITQRAALFLAGLVFFVSLVPALTSPTGAAQAASEEELKAAIKLMEKTGAAQSVNAILPTLLKQQMAVVKAANPNLDAATIDRFETILLEEFRAGMDDMLRGIAAIYPRHLTLGDMNELIAFYETDLGKKLVTKMPTIMQESMQVGFVVGAKMGQEAMNRAMQKAKDEGLEL